MRIAMFGHKHFPSREGGIEVVVEELSVRMVLQGCKVTCYNRSGHHISGAHIRLWEGNIHKGVRVKTVPTIKRKGLAAATSSAFSALFSALGPYDVVHVHAEGPAVFCWLPKLMGKKVVVTVHGLDWQREKWKRGFGSRYIRLGERMAVRWADEMIVLSRRVQEYFMDTYGRKTSFIPNGVTRPEKAPPEEIRARYGLEQGSYILYLGRIVPEKGEHYLIEAFRQTATDKKLVLVGGASDTNTYMEELKQMAAGDERILFTGFVQGRLLEELYSNAYLYCLPSDLEGMPLSLLEAMSYGNCCLTSDIEECTEVVEDCGVSFRKGSVEDLREKLQYLIDHPEVVRGYQEQAADAVCRKYSWDDTVKKTLEVYMR